MSLVSVHSSAPLSDALEKLKSRVGVTEDEWRSLQSNVSRWHRPIEELLANTDQGKDGVLHDYAYASSKVDRGE